MAVTKYLVDLDLSKQQLLNAVVQNLASAPGAPLDGQIYWDTAQDSLFVWRSSESKWVDLGSDGVTNLSSTTTTTTATVVSSDGTNAVLPQAIAGGKAGVLSGSDKTKIDNAVLTSDTTTSGMNFVIDEDNMSSNSPTKLPTQQSVKAYVDGNIAANDAMVFKGTIGSGGTIEIAAFNSLATYDAGWAYKVITAGTIKGEVSEIGDLFMANVDRPSGGVDADWAVLQTNIDGAVVGPSSAVTNRVATFNGTSGKLIKDSGLLLSGSNTGDQDLSELISNATDIYTSASKVTNIISLTQIDYDNITNPDVNTLYIII